LGQNLAGVGRRHGDGLELVTSHYAPSDPEGSLAAAARAAAAAGTRVAVVDFAGNLIAEEEAERLRAEEAIGRVIRLAAGFGARGVNGSAGPLVGRDPGAWSQNGSRLATPVHYDRAADALRRLGRAAEQEGLWISLELHMNTPHDTASSARRLLDLVDHASVVANLDPGNMYAVADAEPIAEAVEILGPRLGYVHLKNCRRIAGAVDYSWPLDSGDIDFDRGLRAIAAAGYTGDYCIEYCGRGDPSVAAERDARYFRSLRAEIEEAQ